MIFFLFVDAGFVKTCDEHDIIVIKFGYLIWISYKSRTLGFHLNLRSEAPSIDYIFMIHVCWIS